MRYLTRDEIVDKNIELLQDFGGFIGGVDNLLNPGQLDYLCEAVRDDRLCVSLTEKAAFYAHRIITGHTFNDGNKRTGLACALLFLVMNGISYSVTNDEIERTALGVEDKTISREKLSALIGEWISRQS